MFEKVYSVSLEPGGKPFAFFVSEESATAVARMVAADGTYGFNLVSAAPLFVSVEDLEKADEEERKAKSEKASAIIDKLLMAISVDADEADKLKEAADESQV